MPESFGGFRMAAFPRQVYRSLAVVCFGGLRPMRQQHVDQRHVASGGGQVQGRYATAGCGIDIRASVEQPGDQRVISLPGDGCMERCVAHGGIGGEGVHVGVVIQQEVGGGSASEEAGQVQRRPPLA